MSSFSSLCSCGTMRGRKTAGPHASFPGREYFQCPNPSCKKDFEWCSASPSRLFNQTAGPECDCGKASVERTVKKEGITKGRKFWSCAAYPRGCRFFEWKDSSSSNNNNGETTPDLSPAKSPVATTPTKKRRSTPGFANYLTDWHTMGLIEKMMAVVPEQIKAIGQASSCPMYDKLDVVGAWKITNHVRLERYEKALREEAGKSEEYSHAMNQIAPSRVQLQPQAYDDAMFHLGKEVLRRDLNEVFLMHSTSPQNLYDILFEGLDPNVSSDGRFGRGVYFAENAAKCDQYATLDRKYEGGGNYSSSPSSSLAKLHERIYGRELHPTNVCYCLISRVILGQHYAITKDGKERLTGEALFANESRNRLSSMVASDQSSVTPMSLVAETGERLQTFREFVVFEADRVFVDYLVAYKRVRSLCGCNLPVAERTVTKEGENRGRKIYLCGRIGQDEDRKCNFLQMMPLCDCGRSAGIGTSRTGNNPGRKFYCCNKRGRGGYYSSTCDFFGWVERTVCSPVARSPSQIDSHSKRTRYGSK